MPRLNPVPHHRHRPVDLPGDPLLASTIDYAFNIFAAGLLRAADLRDEELLVLLEAEGARARGRRVEPVRALAAPAFRRRLTALVRREGHALRVPRPPQQPLRANVDLVAGTLGLDELDRQILLFALACRDYPLQSLLDPLVCETPRALAIVVGTALARQPLAVERALRRESRLPASGLLTVARVGDVDDRLALDARLVEVLSRDALDDGALMEQFVPAAPPPSLSVADYPHLAAPIDLGRRILVGALQARRPGVNLLLHGPTGTGKSELARALATAATAPLYVAGRTDQAGNSPSATERLTSLRFGHRLLAGGAGLLLFDELEDLFEASSYNRVVGIGHDRSHMSKQWFNLLLESNPVPTIWISNAVDGIDPAFLRRFTFIIEVGAPTTGQRRRAWTRHLGDGHRLAPQEIDALAARFEVSPAHISGAIAAARLAAPAADAVDRPTLEAVLAPAEAVVAGRKIPAAAFDAGQYRPALVNTPVDLAALADRLATFRPEDGTPGISLCLYGPPGTGKSAYVRYLAHRMDRPLVLRRCSDLLGCWVGETEKNIAAAFIEAQQEQGVLLFDEADSFLQDRRNALHSWEVTQVNELLQQLEAFPGVVACTTNLFRNLDQAALRRFTFKVPFDFLRPAQAEALFASVLASLGGSGAAPPRALARLPTLTPGDFAAAARRLRALRERVTPERLLAELRAEVQVKEGARSRIGF